MRTEVSGEGRSAGRQPGCLVPDIFMPGLASKVMAEEMGLSKRTVELHRSRVMDKMGASSIAQLVRMFTDSQRAGMA